MDTPYLVVPTPLPETKSKLSSDFKNFTYIDPSTLSKSILKSPPGMSGSACYCFPSRLEPPSAMYRGYNP
ncbi:hypothetical protein TNCV_3705661 [Trichonephila clavipes]|nr:hypothetical protein TNCV_3705661 [Trichonephila clavipes]